MKRILKLFVLAVLVLVLLTAVSNIPSLRNERAEAASAQVQGQGVLQAGKEYWEIRNSSNRALPFSLTLYPDDGDPYIRLYPCNETEWYKLFSGPSFVPPQGHVYVYAYESDEDNSNTRAVLKDGSGCTQESYWRFRYSDHMSLVETRFSGGWLYITISADNDLPTKGLGQIQVALKRGGNVVDLLETGVGDIKLLEPGETVQQRLNLKRHPVEFDEYEVVIIGLETLP